MTRITKGRRSSPGPWRSRPVRRATPIRWEKIVRRCCAPWASTPISLRCSTSTSNRSIPSSGARAFSDDPQVVSRLGIDMMTGLKRRRHAFRYQALPGHGNVKKRFPSGCACERHARAGARAEQWVPFQNAFWAGAEALMTCHVLYREIDPRPPRNPFLPDHDRTASEQTALPSGLVITDCLEMDAIRAAYGIAEGAVLAVEAGCDMLTFSHTLRRWSRRCSLCMPRWRADGFPRNGSTAPTAGLWRPSGNTACSAVGHRPGQGAIARRGPGEKRPARPYLPGEHHPSF